MKPTFVALPVSALLLFGSPAPPTHGQAGEVRSLGDLFTGEGSNQGSSPADFTPLGSSMIFSAITFEHQRELWITDGTSQGTELLKDIYPGAASGGNMAELTFFEGRVYFRADDASHGSELWSTDGTPEGTQMVADIWPGALGHSQPRDLTVAGDTLFFTALTEEYGRELWRYTADGVLEMVVDLVPGEESSNPTNLLAHGDAVAFSVEAPGVGRELARSNGTEEGTEVFDIETGPGDSDPVPLAATATTIYFSAETTTHGRELRILHTSNGATCPLEDAVPGDGDSDPEEVVLLGSDIIWTAETGSGPGLWRSIGLCAPLGQLVASLDARGLTVFDSKVYFASDGDLWETDGTAGGTTMIASPGIQSAVDGFQQSTWLREWDGYLWFTGDGGIWRSDGTAGNTKLRASCPDCAGGVNYFRAGADALYFSYNNGFTGREPWRLSHSAFSLVKDIRRDVGNSLPLEFTEHDGSVYFSAFVDGHGRELVSWDGVAAEATLVEDLMPGADDSHPTYLRVAGPRLYYAALAPTVDVTLRVLEDPSLGSTVAVDLAGETPIPLAALGSELLFAADDEENVAQLWKTSGSGGVQLSSFAPPGSNGVDFQEPVAVAGGKLFFVADDGTHGDEVWRSDGVSVGMVDDLVPGPSSSFPFHLTSHDGLAWFVASDSSNRYLWSTDGSVQNTTPVADNALGFPLSFGSQLFFAGSDEAGGIEPWITDGTPGSETRLLDLNPGPEQGLVFPGNELGIWQAASGSTIYFQAYHPDTGIELWASDGTPGGTHLVSDLVPGTGSSLPWFLVPLPTGEIVFSAWTPSHGYELWRTDGTGGGTHRVTDIAPGADSSQPLYPTLFGGWVVFLAHSGGAGWEPWAYDWTESGLIFRDRFESGDTTAWN